MSLNNTCSNAHTTSGVNNINTKLYTKNDTDTNSTFTNSSTDSASKIEHELYQASDSDEHTETLESKDQCPATICTTNTIGLLKSRKLFKVLLDSGSSACLIKRSALPKGIVPRELKTPKRFKTLAGKLLTHSVVTLRDLRLPEFDKNRRVDQQCALILDSESYQ